MPFGKVCGTNPFHKQPQFGTVGGDITPPTESSASISTNGTSLTVNFSRAVTGFAAHSDCGFAMTGLTGGATTLQYSSGDGTTAIVFTINRAVAQSESGGVLAYTPGSITAVANGVALAAFSGKAVTNGSTQVPAAFNVASILSNGTQLQTAYTLGVTGFGAGANGYALTGLSGGATTLTYLSGSGTDTILFTISRTVASTETGAVLAYVPGSIATVGNSLAVAAFSGQSVTNLSSQTPPTVSTVAISSNGTTVTVTGSVSLTGHTGFTITPSGGAASLTYASGDPGTGLVFTASRIIIQGETATWAYTPGNVVGTANSLAMASGSGSVTNNSTVTVPTFGTPSIPSAGTSISFPFSQSVTNHAGITVACTSGGAAVTLTYSSGDPGTPLVFTTSRTISKNETFTFSYTPGNIVGTVGGAAVQAASGSVTNNSTQAYLSDTFVGTNGTNLTAHTMLIGPGWIATSINMVIESNKATQLTDSTGSSTVEISNAGQADGTLAVDVQVPASGNYFGGLSFRYEATGANGYEFVLSGSGGTFTWAFYSFTGGSANLITSGITSDEHNQAVTLSVVLSGSSVILKVNGSTVSTQTQATYATQTYQGLAHYKGGGYTACNFTSFSFS